MIDITPLDVRKKKSDFPKAMRGYDVQQVDMFLDLVAERLEELVLETMTLRERTAQLQVQVDAQTGRERAVQEALVTAQSLRDQIKEQAGREADLALREAGVEARRMVAEAERAVEERRVVLDELERKRARFLKALRLLLERELDRVAVEEGRSPLNDAPVGLELAGERRQGGGRGEGGPAPRGDASAPVDQGGPPGEGSSGAAPGAEPTGSGSVPGELRLGLGEEPVPRPDPEEEEKEGTS